MNAASAVAAVTATVTSARHGASSTDERPAATNNRQFMELVVVWPGVNNPGWINLHCHLKNADPSKNDGKDWVIGWPHKAADSFLRQASWVESTAQFFDVWYCTSQQSEATQNKTNGKAKAVRKARNATWLKAIWIDCDVKPDDTTGKHYTSNKEAWAALSAFSVKVGLPPPSAVVHSGGGFHTYWISDEPLSPQDWRGYAEGLKALLIQEGVKCDTGLTTDSARLLRVPGTLNHKYSPPRTVEILHLRQMYDFATHLSVLQSVSQIKPVTNVPSPPLAPAIVPGRESSFDKTRSDLRIADRGS
ncbi:MULTISPECIES: hypothetical protein [unclassified Bradyrhizobium]|uniref:hypothetical protein n=1 Tax=unclassified Bradyrhizobium TaxID=2631580 RepID=UPI001FFBD442|nr:MULTISPECIES: hypothetical protein [unclassified Bradyrhizobium]MCK1711403.1 hypothetical protein [Bradyrhizobium sp. 143]MCK1731676.1 hypothetical protein [Bradyrhizobium sp. 142]